jgi:hypothetical protein
LTGPTSLGGCLSRPLAGRAMIRSILPPNHPRGPPMRSATLTRATALAVLLAVPATAHAQRAGRPAPKAPESADFARMTLPTAKVVKERANVAAFVVEKGKKLGLDAAVVDSLKALAKAIDERNAPALEGYDDLRTKVRADQNTGENETLEGRARVAMAGTAIDDLGKARMADREAVLALVPADKQEAVKKLIADQDEDFAKLNGRRGGAPRRP